MKKLFFIPLLAMSFMCGCSSASNSEYYLFNDKGSDSFIVDFNDSDTFNYERNTETQTWTDSQYFLKAMKINIQNEKVVLTIGSCTSRSTPQEGKPYHHTMNVKFEKKEYAITKVDNRTFFTPDKTRLEIIYDGKCCVVDELGTFYTKSEAKAKGSNIITFIDYATNLPGKIEII